MRPHLTLITAVATHLAGYLEEAARSVGEAARLCADAGWPLGWSVCVDGVEDEGIAATARLSGLDASGLLSVVSLGGSWGVSTARNVAASVDIAANAEWVLPLDADDLAVGPGLRELCELVASLEKPATWVGTNRTELDGSPPRSRIDARREMPPGVANAEYTHPYCVHPNNVAYRPAVVVASGGWPATPGGEDLALFLQVAKHHSGILDPAVTVRYRRWESQTVRQGEFTAGRPMRYLVLSRRDLLGGRDPEEMRRPQIAPQR